MPSTSANFVTVSERDLGRGIDARSTENNIQAGYAEDLVNADTSSSGQLSKRRGYQGYYGYLPMRVQEVSHSGTDITLTLDNAVDIDEVVSSPIVVYGKLSSSQSGDWSNSNNAEYYESFTTNAVRSLTAPSGTITVDEADHGNDTEWLFTQLVERTSGTSNQSNSHIWADAVQVAASDPHDVDFDYTVGSNTFGSALVADKAASSTEVYNDSSTVQTTNQSFTFGDGDVDTGADTITETSHNLFTGAIVRLTTTGTLPTGLSAGTDYYVIRATANTFKLATTAANADAGTAVDITAASGGGTHTLTASSRSLIFPASTHGLANFNIQVQVYYNKGGGERERVVPNEVKVDPLTGLVEVNLINSASATVFYTILNTAPITNTYTELVSTGSQSFTLEDTGSFNFVSTYINDSGKLRQVLPTSVVYTSSTDDTVITVNNSTGAAESYTALWEPVTLTSSSLVVTDNSSTSTTYSDSNPQMTLWGISHNGVYTTSGNREGHVSHIDTYRSDLEERLITGLGGNLFAARTRSDVGTDYLIPSTDITIQNRIATDAVIGPLFVTTGGAGTARTRGAIVDDSISANKATVTAVSRVSDTEADYTLTFTNKTGTISTSVDTTDQFVITGMAHGVWNGTFALVSVQSESTTEAVLRLANSNDHLDEFNETGAVGTAACYTDKATLTATTQFNEGDTVSGESFEDIAPTVLSSSGTTIYLAGLTEPISLPTGATLFGTRTTATLPVTDTDNFVKGDMCALGGYTRQVRVTDIDTANSTVTIDETVEVSDGTVADTLAVVGRWIPIEAPSTTDDLPVENYYQHFDSKDYEKQSIVRSVMVADNLYLTNNDDEVLKYDGTNLYQAGLFRWQPQLFVQLDTTTTSIARTGPVATQPGTAASDNKFTVGLGEEAQFQVGDTVVHSGDGAVYTVQSTDDDGTNGLVYVTGTISDTTTTDGTVEFANRYRYYFRLNAVDANRNIIASAATGASDFLFDLTEAGQIHMRLIGFPVWGNYDYDRLEVEVYRTAADTSGPFFRVRGADIDFNHGEGYIDVVDSTNDEDLQDLDVVSTALLGAELGTAWEQPLRAKYITSIGNSLILANAQDYPELDIVLRKAPGATSVTAANLDQKSFLFRKDSSDTGTSTDMVTRAKYEFVDGGAVTITPNTDIASTASNFTITSTGHNLSVKDWVYLYHNAASKDNELNFAGWFQIASVTSNTFTIDFSGHGRGTGGGATTDVDRFVTASTASDIPVWLGTDGNYNQVGGNTIDEFTAMLRLANAINASMRMTDTTASGQSSFVPWLTANAGSEYGIGRLVVRQPGVFENTPEVVLPGSISTADIFVGSVLRAASAEVSASTKLFPSRVIISYPNYPEIFDNPFGSQQSTRYTIDVNSADGQEITGIIPFFGSAVFGSGQVEGVLVVFKTNSIYLLDVRTGQYAKIQSRGLGCTAPRSIASTRDGVIFANESGIYRLNQNQTITYVGKFVERIWEDEVNTDRLSEMSGHHYGTGRQYKLSVPVGSANDNSEVLVYDHEREGRGQELGAWTTYDNHPATGWANLGRDAFFCTTDGQVFSVRRANDSSDYRDDASAISMTILGRAMDFGAQGIRKIIGSVISHFQLRRSGMDGTSIAASEDLDGTFTDTGNFNFTKDSNVKVVSASSSLARRRMQYLQLKYTNSTKDEDVVLSGIDYEVAGLSDLGIPEQAETT